MNPTFVFFVFSDGKKYFFGFIYDTLKDKNYLNNFNLSKN